MCKYGRKVIPKPSSTKFINVSKLPLFNSNFPSYSLQSKHKFSILFLKQWPSFRRSKLFEYKFLGIIANSALVINLVLLIGILTILEATLTLPGIAGIILTVGMAVDANVLIFERIKEEMKNEKSLIHSFDMGYKKAQTAVLDANITTLISAIILFFLGSGPVKGFAVTLGIGIITTLFSAYFFARHLSSIFVMKNKDKKFSIWFLLFLKILNFLLFMLN